MLEKEAREKIMAIQRERDVKLKDLAKSARLVWKDGRRNDGDTLSNALVA